MPIEQRNRWHEGHDVDVTANSVGLLTHAIVLSKAPVPNGGLAKGYYSLNTAWILLIKVISEDTTDSATGRVASNRNSFALLYERSERGF